MPRNDLASLVKAFDAIPAAARKPILPALEKGAEEMVDRMRLLAPHKTGKLRSSIQYAELNELAVRVHAGGEKTTKPVRNSEKGNAPEFDYALATEFGRVGEAASPFFWPSYRGLKKRVRRRVDRAVSDAVKKAFEQ
jgi:HK97 gp10 family phage protein